MITNYSQLTINKYQDIRNILEEDGGELNIQARIIACLNDMDEDTVFNLSLSKYSELAQQTAFLMEKPKLDGRFPSRIIVNGKECHLVTNVSKLTAGQYIDYQSYISLPDQEKYLANILACFFIPKGCQYGEGYDTDEIAKWIGDNLSIKDAMNICFFFRKKYLRSIKRMLTYLESQMTVIRWKVKDPTMKEKMKEISRKMEEYQTLLENVGAGYL